MTRYNQKEELYLRQEFEKDMGRYGIGSLNRTLKRLGFPHLCSFAVEVKEKEENERIEYITDILQRIGISNPGDIESIRSGIITTVESSFTEESEDVPWHLKAKQLRKGIFYNWKK